MYRLLRNIIGKVIRRISFTYFIYKKYYLNNIVIDNTVKLYVTKGNLSLSNNVQIGAFNVIYAIDSVHSSKKGVLKIGANTSIGEFNNIRAAGGSIIIGSDCLISQFVTLVASNHNIQRDKKIINQGWDENKTDIIIGNDVWIGANCIILPGVNIGSGSIIAAGTIVTKDVPEFSVIIGSPGKVVRERY